MGNIDPGKPNGNGRWEPGQDKHIQENANTNKCNQSSCAEHNDAAFQLYCQKYQYCIRKDLLILKYGDKYDLAFNKQCK